MITISHIGKFEEKHDGNRVAGLPRYIAAFIDHGENPFREYLSELEPGHFVAITIQLEYRKIK